MGRWKLSHGLDEAADLLGAFGGHGAAVVVAVVGQHADRVPVDAGQPGDLAAAEARGHLEEGAPVDHQLDHPADLVGAAAVARDDLEQLRLLARARVAQVEDGRCLPDARGQVRQELPGLPPDVRLVLGHVVDDAAAPVDPCAAEILLARLLVQRALHQGGPARQHLGGVPRHDRQMRGDETAGGKARDGTESGADHRHVGEGLHAQQVERRRGRQVVARAPAGSAGARDRGAAGLEEAHQGDPAAHGQLVRVEALLEPDRRVGRAADGEVVAAHHHPAAVDARGSHHHVRRGEGGQPAFRVELAGAGDAAVLPEAVPVDQRGNPLADGAATSRVLPGDGFAAAVERGELPAPCDGVRLGLPAHGRGLYHGILGGRGPARAWHALRLP